MTRILKLLLKTACVALAIVVILIFTLQNSAVQKRVVHFALTFVETSYDLEISVDHMSGTFPWRLQIDRIDIKDTIGTHVVAEDIYIDWSPQQLIWNRIGIERVSIQKLVVELPEKKQSATPISWPALNFDQLPEINLGHFTIDQATVAGLNTQQLTTLQLSTSVKIAHGQKKFDLDLQSVGQPGDYVTAHISHITETDELQVSLQVSLSDEGVLAGLFDDINLHAIRATISGDGVASSWLGNIDFAAGNLMTGNFTMMCQCLEDWRISIKGTLQGELLRSLVGVGQIASPLEINLAAGRGTNGTSIAIDKLDLQKDGIVTRTSGLIDYQRGAPGQLAFEGLGTIELPPEHKFHNYVPDQWSLRGLAEENGQISISHLRVSNDIASLEFRESLLFGDFLIAGNFQGEINAASFLTDTEIAKRIGTIQLNGMTSLSRGMELILKDTRIKSQSAQIEMVSNANYKLKEDVFHGSSLINFTSPIEFDDWSVVLKGPVQADINASSLKDGGQLLFAFDLPKIAANDMSFPQFQLKGRIEDPKNFGKGNAVLTTKGGTALLSEASAGIAFDQSGNANCFIDLKSQVKGDEVSGQMDMCVKHDTNGVGRDVYDVSALAKNVRWQEHSGKEVATQVTWIAEDGDAKWSGTISGVDLNLSGLLVTSVETAFSGRNKDRQSIVRVETAAIKLEEQSYTLRDPVEVTAGTDNVIVSPVFISANNGGSVSLSCLSFGNEIFAEGAFERFVPPVFPATIDGEFSIAIGNLQNQADLDVIVKSHALDLPPSEIRIASQWRKDVVTGSAGIVVNQGELDEVAGRFADWRVPLALTRKSDGWHFKYGAASANLAYDGPIDPLMSLFPIYSHSLSGRLVLDANLEVGSKGSLWNGDVALHDASYAFERGGVVIDDFEMSMKVEGQGLRIDGTLSIAQESLGGENDNRPRLIGNGTASYRSLEEWQIEIGLNMTNSPLLHHAYYEGVASGRLELIADPKKAELKGRIKLDQLDAVIPPPQPQEVVSLKIIPVDASGAPIIREAKKRSTSLLPELQVDVQVESNEKLFIRGRGIETEWRAIGQVKGPVSNAALTGDMESKRGRIDFGGRQFLIEKGKVSVVDGGTENAALEIVARYDVPDGTTARIVVGGTVGSPTISFTSDPSLPEEEIVALILFGKSVKDLGAMEALRTGAAIAQASGRVGTFDGSVFERARRAVGIDYLSIDPQGGNGHSPIVTAGKYLGKGLFLTLTEGLDEQQGALAIEYSITDAIILKTQVNEASETENSILWKRDY